MQAIEHVGGVGRGMAMEDLLVTFVPFLL